MKNNFTIGCFAIILDEQQRVLLCHRRDYDLWNLPGGGLNENEAPWECVVREVREETGLDVEVVRLAGIYSKRNEVDVIFSFICKIIGGEFMQSNEADDIKYFSFEEIPRNTSPKQVERIADVLNGKDNELTMKIQIGPSSIELIRQGKL